MSWRGVCWGFEFGLCFILVLVWWVWVLGKVVFCLWFVNVFVVFIVFWYFVIVLGLRLGGGEGVISLRFWRWGDNFLVVGLKIVG